MRPFRRMRFRGPLYRLTDRDSMTEETAGAPRFAWGVPAQRSAVLRSMDGRIAAVWFGMAANFRTGKRVGQAKGSSGEPALKINRSKQSRA